MSPIDLLEWKTVLALLLGGGTLILAFKVKLSITINFNELLAQFIQHRDQAIQRRLERACPHVHPVDVNGFGSRPGFRAAYQPDEDGSFTCGMCGFTGYTTPEMVTTLEAYWSTRTWRHGEK